MNELKTQFKNLLVNKNNTILININLKQELHTSCSDYDPAIFQRYNILFRLNSAISLKKINSGKILNPKFTVKFRSECQSPINSCSYGIFLPQTYSLYC